MATIDDVAKRAGLSPTTVSRVLNNHPHVARQKKALVHKAIEELDYVPNSMAQRLRKQTTETIAVLIPRIANLFFGQLVESMEMLAGENDFNLVICQTNNDKQRELKYLNLLTTKQVDGIILTSIENHWDDIKPYMKHGPIIFCNEYDETACIPIIRLNQFEGGYMATRHLIEKGYKKIAKCTGFQHTSLSQDRTKGFTKALDESGIVIKPEWRFSQAFTIENGKQILRNIAKMTDKPNAIFTGSDEVAAGIIKEAKRLGLMVPDELAVIGYDDQPIAELIEPGITTIHQPIKEIGEKAMELMIDLLTDKQNLDNKLIELPLHLVVREST